MCYVQYCSGSLPVWLRCQNVQELCAVSDALTCRLRLFTAELYVCRVLHLSYISTMAPPDDVSFKACLLGFTMVISFNYLSVPCLLNIPGCRRLLSRTKFCQRLRSVRVYCYVLKGHLAGDCLSATFSRRYFDGNGRCENDFSTACFALDLMT